MFRRPEPQNTASPGWWVRLCQWLWGQRGVIWGTLIIGIFVSVAATWLTSSTSIFTGTPLGTILLWIREHLLLAGLIGVILFLLTLLVGVVSQRADIPTRAGATADQQQQNRRAFIQRLHSEYRRQMAESLQGAAMMTLALQTRTDVVLTSVSLVSWHMDAPSDHSSPAPTSIVQAYDDAGGGLLLLGAPGAGKSTLLRELASELLTRVEEDDTHTQPIPVILNLSSWAIKKPPLTTWLVDQLQLVYAIPHRVSQTLIEQELLLLLLDGLDEMEPSAQSDCIEAINAYRDRAEYVVPIVVCSRSQEYLAQKERLRVPVAIEVRPLTPVQIDGYLKGVGKPLASVRVALQSNVALRDLVSTPLMLSVVMLAYRGKTVKDLPQLGSAEEQQRQVFEHYVTWMLEQRARKWHYASQQTRKWLIWLAGQMKQHQLTEFYLERLQATWLSTRRPRIVYALISGLAFGLVLGSLVGLFGVVIGGLVGGLAFGLPGVVIGGLGGWVVFWLVFGLLGGLFGWLGRLNAEKFTWSWRTFWRGQGGKKNWDIRPAEKLTWSWRAFWQGLILGGLAGGLFGMVLGGLVFGLLGWLGVAGFGGGPINGLYAGVVLGSISGLLLGLLYGLRGGLSNEQIDEHIRLRPNQGIRDSGWNALRSGLGFWLVFGLVGALTGGLVGALVGKVPTGLGFGLLAGLVFGLIFGPSVGLGYGGVAYLQHYSLRFLLWRRGAMPWRYVRFLEETTERILLQRVGGGYRFIHPLFLGYFAVLSTYSRK